MRARDSEGCCTDRAAWISGRTSVKDIVPKAEEKIVKVVVTQWNANEQVGFPLSMLPPQMRANVSIGAFLLATVNTAAAGADDLFFEDFELPHPDDVKAVRTQFNHRRRRSRKRGCPTRLQWSCRI